MRARAVILVVSVSLTLSACGMRGDPPALPDAARFVPPAVTLPTTPAADDARLAPVQDALKTAPLVTLPPPEAVQVPREDKRPAGKGRTQGPPSIDPVTAAEQGSLLTPSRGGYAEATSAVLRYPYRMGAVYVITTSPNHPTTLLLPPGLRLASPPSLDPDAWDVGFAEMGTDAERQEAIIVRPTTAGLEATTPLLTKSGHLLLCRLKSQEKAAVLAVTWELPVVRVVTPAGPGAGGGLHAPTLALDRLHTQYRIEPGKRPVNWAPVEAYDDGSVTVIRFAESLAYTAAPVLMALDADGKHTLPVEYTTYAVPGHADKGEFYVTRGLYPRLQLRDGVGGTVTIVRLPTPAPVYREQAPAR